MFTSGSFIELIAQCKWFSIIQFAKVFWLLCKWLMVLEEKFWKEIRGVYNQRVPWVQIMIDRHQGSRNRALGCVLQIIHPQNWLLFDKCTIYETTTKRNHSLKKLPVSLRCCWADRDFFVFCSNSLDPPDPDLCRFFAFSGHAKLLSRELPKNIIGRYLFSHFN